MCVCVCVCVWCTCVCLRPCARVSECAYISFSNRAWCRPLQCVWLFFSVLQFVKLQLLSRSDTGRIIRISQTQWGMQCVAVVLQLRKILSACALYVQYSQYVACWKKGWTALSTMTIIQHTATHCNTLQCTATHWNTHFHSSEDAVCQSHRWQGGTILLCSSRYLDVCYSVLQCNAACCSVLKEARYSYVPPGILMYVAEHCCCVAVCCRLL